MIDFLGQVDEYCERTDFQLLSEPLNLFSNLLFWVAALAACREIIRSRPSRSSALWSMLILVFLVGFGSALFHSYATRWAKICDVGFIGLYVLWFLWSWARHVLRIPLRQCWQLLLVFFGVTGMFQLLFFRLPVNGSQGYFGVALFLFMFGLQQRTQLSRSHTLTRTAWIFVAALVFRTWDEQLCEIWPYGTHFLWHSGNALVCYLTLRGMREELEWQDGYRGLMGPRTEEV